MVAGSGRESGVNEAMAAAVAEAFGLGAVTGSAAYVTRGAMGEIYRLDTDRGAWAVKRLFPWDEPWERPFDVEVQLRASAAGIPLPRPCQTSDGRAAVRVEDRFMRAYEWVDVREPLPAPVAPDVAERVGFLLGTLHRLAITATGPVDSWYTAAPSPVQWDALLARGQHVGAPWVDALAEQRSALLAMGDFIAERDAGPAITCHRDFDVTNVLPHADGDLVVLDWESSGPLHPDGEVAYVLLCWTSVDGRIDPAAAHALLWTYRGAGAPDPRLTQASFNVAVATQLNFLRLLVEQSLDDPDHRAYADSRIPSILSGCRPLSAAVHSAVDVLELPDE